MNLAVTVRPTPAKDLDPFSRVLINGHRCDIVCLNRRDGRTKLVFYDDVDSVTFEPDDLVDVITSPEILPYVEKPARVEAVRLTEDNFQDLVEWTDGALEDDPVNGNSAPYVTTQDGTIKACNFGDFIIKEANGGFASCKADVFVKSYRRNIRPGTVLG